MKRLRITVEGKTYEVTVELDNEPAASPAAVSPSPISTSASVSTAAPGVVVSPLAGNMVAINVKVGQAVKEGEQVAVLEAMKMNTSLNAPQAGKVAEIMVAVGAAVQEGQALLRIE